jgi:hypothetical protein
MHTGVLHMAARIAGLVWMTAAITAGVMFFVRYAATIQHPDMHGNGLVWSLILLSVLPGYLLWRLGKGPFKMEATPSLQPKAPYDQAAEAGHVMRIDPHA